MSAIEEPNRTTGATPGRIRPAVPLTSDFVFKYVFGADQSTECLRSLLSAIQEDAGCPALASVQVTNPFNLKESEEDKLSVVDVRATDIRGTTFTVEAQATYHAAFPSRALYYWARAYGKQLQESEFYSRLQPVVGVNLLDFLLFPQSAGAPMHTSFRPYCREAPHLDPLGDLMIHFIELPRFDPPGRMPSTAFARWMYYIKYRSKEDAMEDPIMKAILEDTSEIREAEKRYQAFTADEELQDRLEARDKFRRTHLQLLHDAEQKGLQQGIERGREEGREEERAKRLESARRLKDRKMSLEEIAEITNLTLEEIQQL
ncbi:conserved hypothetical protein (putative transposase or invertase) [Alkalispirochaeta americana]|uniref:Rpn family recombination-promoting nuclease/putative transposase n=1 Tax=Alkalispirochaeta americana TaxID=159291 RepID=A0A1N6S1G6_9SPIO|nr:Rpn family recombination-promoting nuclease/putative transposase [Alkalispirochaeta americana]SIQ34911.1 conserved hypothetical protein (putative transposase or invertase) [Alkalispirochaeta americana]